MSAQLRVWVPHLPPSSNQIYVQHPTGKGRILSDKARTFKIKAMRAIQKAGRVALLQLKQNVPYELALSVFFEAVEVKQSKTGARYKKMDLSNVIKLIEDTVAKAVGVDDCHNFRLRLEKHCDPKNPGIYVTLREIPEEEVGLTKEDYERLELQHDEPVRAGGTVLAERFLRGASGSRPRSTRKPTRRRS
jgi:Holliday junction resolvase RusA-like endonuclease